MIETCMDVNFNISNNKEIETNNKEIETTDEIAGE